MPIRPTKNGVQLYYRAVIYFMLFFENLSLESRIILFVFLFEYLV